MKLTAGSLLGCGISPFARAATSCAQFALPRESIKHITRAGQYTFIKKAISYGYLLSRCHQSRVKDLGGLLPL